VNPPKDQEDLEQIRTFRFFGTITDRFMELTLCHRDRSRIGIVTYLLKVVGDGHRMRGSAAYYDLTDCQVSHADIEFQ
jgi:hypothetical protein